MIVVSNASPLVSLNSVQQLALLRTLYDRVLVPDAVWREVFESERQKATIEASPPSWLERRAVEAPELAAALQQGLDAGESEAIALALESNADLLLMDERLGRRIAQRLGIHVIGVIGVLIEAKHKGLIPAIRPVIETLREKVGFRLSETLVDRVLHDEDEADGP